MLVTESTTVSLGLAFSAGLVSFLSPCVLPLVPSYLTFVTGMTLDELTADGGRAARGRAMVHAALFVLGFTVVFVSLGATATALGAAIGHSLWESGAGRVAIGRVPQADRNGIAASGSATRDPSAERLVIAYGSDEFPLAISRERLFGNLSELNDDELIRLVSLDLNAAMRE